METEHTFFYCQSGLELLSYFNFALLVKRQLLKGSEGCFKREEITERHWNFCMKLVFTKHRQHLTSSTEGDITEKNDQLTIKETLFIISKLNGTHPAVQKGISSNAWRPKCEAVPLRHRAHTKQHAERNPLLWPPRSNTGSEHHWFGWESLTDKEPCFAGVWSHAYNRLPNHCRGTSYTVQTTSPLNS